MAPEHPIPQPLPDGPRLVSGLADLAGALRRLGYTVDAVGGLLQVEGELSGRPADLAVYRRRLDRRPGPLADIVALLALGLAVARDRIAKAFGETAWRALVASGAVTEYGASAVSAVRLMPHGNLLVASDRRPVPGEPVAPLHVTGINAPAGLLASLTVRRPVADALDIGTGNGIQALLAAHHADRVIATDVNPRALAFAAFNAALNDVDNVEFRRGSIFEPVAAEQFDLIVCNPPYVISPDADFVYRDSGSSPAALCGELVSELPSRLTPGGFATVLASWPSAPGEDWSAEPRSWLRDDSAAWLLHYRAEDPLTHAASWNKPTAESDLAAYGEAIDRWLAFDEQHGIDQISFGAVIMRRLDGARRVVRTDRLRAGHGSASAQIERVFAADAELSNGVDLLGRQLRLATGNRLEQALSFADGEWRAEQTKLVVTEGIGFEGTLDQTMTQVLVLLDGSRTARQAAELAAEQFGEEPSSIVRATERMVGELYGLGLLEAL